MNGTFQTVRIAKPPTGRRLLFRVAFRGTQKLQGFSVVAVAVKPRNGKELPWAATWTDDGKAEVGRWVEFSREYVLPPESTGLSIVIHNVDKQSIYFSDPHLTVGEDAPPDQNAIAAVEQVKREMAEEAAHPKPTIVQKNHDALAAQAGPAIVRLKMRAPLRTKSPSEVGTASFPIPALDASQVPLDFKIEVDKPGKLLGFKWRRRADGHNLLCEARIQPGTKGAWVHYEALVLVRQGPADDTAPADGTLVKSTACVQCSHREILEIAQRLAGETKSPQEYVGRVFEFVRDNRGKGAPFKTLDALAALACEGSCTNRANLSAALLRAHGIPARTVAHMPTWCGPLYEHWLTEYWQPGQGWIAMDPSLGRTTPDRRTRVVIGVSSEADEDRAFDPLHTRFVMPGAPYLSVIELSPTLYPADLTQDDAINVAEQLASLPSKEEAQLFQTAIKAFPAMFRRLSAGKQNPPRFTAIESAAKEKQSRKVLNALR
ncbi:hypothetical protein OP10G_3041 [Fimbriimonas ginsengisoli Gsoil 348]|uniref:Transglutaminase-like domain-containing protein n=2 Tax=Fimbriimonas ginsengisoli TaxID=1005039 RepID=A0A068NXP1_FIMGI|nr:hypothetical protein OP10G_3041 [Fimbriimonas ginsengisoli Gsoil 348]